MIRSGPLSDEVRRFVAGSLEDEAECEREVREAERAQHIYVEPAGHLSWPWYHYRYVIP